MKVGDRVKMLEHSRYRGRIGTIQRYDPSADLFYVLVDDPRPFEIEIFVEHLECYEDPETFTSEEFESIFD